MDNQTMKIDNINPTVNGFSFEVNDTCERLEINMDDLFQWMTIHRPQQAQTPGQFNQTIENMPQWELYQTINDAYQMQPNIFQCANFCRPQTPTPAPQVDSYQHLTDDESPMYLEEIDICNDKCKKLQQLSAKAISVQITTINQFRQMSHICQLLQDFIDSSQGPQHNISLDELWEECIIKRRSVLPSSHPAQLDQYGKRVVTCSFDWLEKNLCMADITCLLFGARVRVQSKSGKGHTIYELTPIKKHG